MRVVTTVIFVARGAVSPVQRKNKVDVNGLELANKKIEQYFGFGGSFRLM